MAGPGIYLTKATSSVEVDTDGSVLCVHHESYDPPRQFSNVIPWRKFSEDFSRLVDTTDTLVVVGLNKIITPANRVKVGAMVLRPRKWRRISVDRTLFVSEPWRAWFHFGCVRAPYHGYSYSYLAETDWRAFLEGKREANPFSLEAIRSAGTGVIRSSYRSYFQLDVETIEVSKGVAAEYAREKAKAFDEEHTIHAILKRLEAVAQRALPERSVPTPARLFATQYHRIIRTNLKVDDFLVGRLQELADTCDRIGEDFYG